MVSAIIVAAGSSRRMGFDKLWATLAGKPVIWHSLNAFSNTKEIGEIIVVARKETVGDFEKLVKDEKLTKVCQILECGRDSSCHCLIQVVRRTQVAVVIRELHDVRQELEERIPRRLPWGRLSLYDSDRVKLVPANPTFPEITFREGQQLIICGVVTAAIKRFT